MSTGALAVVLGNTPNQFNGLQTVRNFQSFHVRIECET
jgi:hypothetical protein